MTAEDIRPVREKGAPVPGSAVCDAGPADGAVQVMLSGDLVHLTVLPARGTFPATVTLPLARLDALINEAISTAPPADAHCGAACTRGCLPAAQCPAAVHDNGDYRV